MASKPDRLLGLVRDSDESADSDASRGSVLDGALESFLDLGMRRTSMGDIARRTGISPASAIPTARPTIPSSLSEVSNTRSTPNFSCRPNVTA